MKQINTLLSTILFLTSILFIPTFGFATTINVPSDQTTIQAGINAASNGDTILVANGTYYENNITFSGKEVVLLSENGPDATFIDGSNSGGIFDCISGETFNTEINGFTIQNGQANEGAAIHIINTSYLTVKNCIIINNSAPGTWTRAAITIGQAYNNGPHTPAGIHMFDCLIEGNSGYYGGGVFNGESGTIASVFERCIFKNNTGTAGAAIFGTRNSIMRYCLFYNNTSSQGTSIINNEGGSPQVTNCTFADNSGYAFCRNSNTLNTEIRNCIFYGNTGTWCQITNASTIVMEYCNDEDNNAGTGNINQIPLFVDPDNGDYTLQSSSPCIDAGDPTSDLDPDGTNADMGAYFYDQSSSPSNTHSLSFDGVDDYVGLTDCDELAGLSEITVGGWVKISSYPSSTGVIVSKWALLEGPNRAYTFRFDGSGNVMVNIRTTNGGDYATGFSTTELVLNQWEHLTFTYSSPNLKLFLNGVEMSSTTTSGGDIIVSSEDLLIGNGTSVSNNYFGYLDEITMWNVSLNSTQIQSYMSTSLVGNESGLVGYWNFNEGTGTTLTDQTSNGNDGTIYGATWSTDVPFTD